jgi:sulfiredoxin
MAGGAIKELEMLRTVVLPIADIYIPVKRRTRLDPKIVNDIAESILVDGQQTPILVRRDGNRYVLIEGLHRLEACKALGESTIKGYIVQVRRH